MRSAFAFALVMACAIALNAQEKTLTEAEFTALHTKTHGDLLKGLKGPIRQTMETESIMDGRPETDYRLASVMLLVPGKGAHHINERTFGGKRTSTESVSIDGRQYVMENDGTWKEISEKPASAEAPKPAQPQTEPEEKRSEFKYLGLQTYGPRKVHVYTKSEWRKKVDAAKGTSSESEIAAKVFVGDDGTFYRFESDSINHFKHGMGRVKIRIEIFADPSITIKAPEVAK